MADMVQTLTDLVEYERGSVISRVILNKKIGSFTLLAFSQGEGLAEHSSPYEIPFMVLEGVAEVIMGGLSYRVGAGQMMLLPASIPHAVKAITNFKMALVLIKE